MNKEINIFDLAFDKPKEVQNVQVLERNLYDKLVKDGFIFSSQPQACGSSYIMSDGKFLFLELNKKVLELSSSDIVTHGSLDMYLVQNGYINETEASRVLCQTDNAIRINDGTNFSFEVLIGLPKNRITASQTIALEDWLYYLLSKNKIYVSVGNDLVSEAFKIYNLRETSPEEVVKKILTYYNNGILRETKDIKATEAI